MHTQGMEGGGKESRVKSSGPGLGRTMTPLTFSFQKSCPLFIFFVKKNVILDVNLNNE